MNSHPPPRRVANVGSLLLTPQENECLFSYLGRKCAVSSFVCLSPAGANDNPNCSSPCPSNITLSEFSVANVVDRLINGDTALPRHKILLIFVQLAFSKPRRQPALNNPAAPSLLPPLWSKTKSISFHNMLITTKYIHQLSDNKG